jgi:hypothetical protein
VVSNCDDARLATWRAAHPGRDIAAEALTLEEAFVAVAGEGAAQ